MEDTMMNTTEEMTVENEEETSMVPCDSTTCEDDGSSVSLGDFLITSLAVVGAGMLIKGAIKFGKKVYHNHMEKKAKDVKPAETTVEVTDVECKEVDEDAAEKKEDSKK